MKKVGIFTLFQGNYNYGGNLQAYALCKKINSMGYDCKVISYISNFNPIYPSLKSQLKQYTKTEASKKIFEKFISKYKSKEFKKIYNVRKIKIDEFKSNLIPHTEVYNDSDLDEISKSFDYCISGSDQVWNPNCARKGFLQLFSKNVTKISYAASVSRNALSEIEAKIMIPAINNFDYVSVREETAKEFLKKDINKDIEITVDPTLLLDKKEWEEISKDDNSKKKYALCYFFSNSTIYRKHINEFCKNNKIELLYIPFAKQEYNRFDLRGEGTPITNLSPEEFLGYFKNAEYIFTDSFHGAVFSIVFENKFLIFDRDRNTKVSMNSRLHDLLNRLNLNERFISLDEIDNLESKVKNDIDYSRINKDLIELRNKSINFLNNALK